MKVQVLLAAAALAADIAAAQPSDGVQWEVIAVAPGHVIFFDARPDRVDSEVESSTVFTFHVLKVPMKGPTGQPYAMYLQRTKFSCLEPKMSREYVVAYDDSWGTVFSNDVATPMVPFALGTATEAISVMACDHVNPTDLEEKFTSPAAAVAFAKAKLASN